MIRESCVLLFGLAARLIAADLPTAQKLPAVAVRGVSVEMVRIPAGEFLMGADNEGERPRHQVKVRSFDMATTEVTVGQFRAFTQATGYKTEAEKENWGFVCCWSKPGDAGWRSRGYWKKEEGATWRNPGFPQSDADPVILLSWQDAAEFCKWLATETGQQFRLPSEAEWEYAARAGSEADLQAGADTYGWSRENSELRTHPVALKKPNAWGLFDTAGNAWEWVADVWTRDYEGAPTDGSARMDGGSSHPQIAPGDGRILRGGGWGLERATLRFADRSPFGSHQRCNNSGFRIARSIQ